MQSKEHENRSEGRYAGSDSSDDKTSVLGILSRPQGPNRQHLLAFQHASVEQRFAQVEARKQKAAMQALSVIMIVMWALWRGRLAKKGCAATQLLMPASLPLICAHLLYLAVHWLDLLPRSHDRLAAFVFVVDCLLCMVLHMLLPRAELPMPLFVCYAVHGWYCLLANFTLSSSMVLHLLHLECVVWIEAAAYLRGENLGRTLGDTSLLVLTSTVAPLLLRTILEARNRIAFCHTSALPLGALGTFWQHGYWRRVLGPPPLAS